MTAKQNRLGSEKSPYLLQHKDNPVHWHPWGEEAFQAARDEGKLIFLSIGYSTCYWCHMMEKDSFEIPEVAEVMNKYFINIKVDREEHPDVDQIYMDAVQGMTGRGGWPMSVFMTPDLKPFFGGAFFWRQQFLGLMERVQEEWTKNPDHLREFGEKVVRALSEESARFVETSYDEAPLKDYFYGMKRRFDSSYGGFGSAPKFPHGMDLMLLLRIHRRSGNADALQMVIKTLDEMARGGLYDHLGGGFHRYSTDERWFAPHFEKMLYDNATLALAYLEAYQVTKNRLYADVARDTLDYVLRDMTSEEGGFYSAEDAGDVEKEGEYYIWTYLELKSILEKDELELVKKLYGVTEEGNWEHGQNILHVCSNADWEKTRERDAVHVRKKLFAARSQRKSPHKDDKVLTSWNGLMIAAMSKGFQVLEDAKYLKAAQSSAAFIRASLFKNGELKRRYRAEDSRFAGTLDDYAFLIDGLLRLFESDFDDNWLDWAVELQKIQDEKFWDGSGHGYFFSAVDETNLFLRKKEFHDSSLPSGNGLALLNLLRLFGLTFDKDYHDRAGELLGACVGKFKGRTPLGYSTALMALDYVLDESKEIAVIGNGEDAHTHQICHFVYQNFLPNKVFAVGGVGGSTTAPLVKDKPQIRDETTVYVCQSNACQAPTTDLEKAKQEILTCRQYSI